MYCLAGGWWGTIGILLIEISPHEEKIQILFTLTASFFLRLTSASASTISTIPLPSTAPGFSPSSHQEKSTPQTGTASVLKLAILAGKFFSRR